MSVKSVPSLLHGLGLSSLSSAGNETSDFVASLFTPMPLCVGISSAVVNERLEVLVGPEESSAVVKNERLEVLVGTEEYPEVETTE